MCVRSRICSDGQTGYGGNNRARWYSSCAPDGHGCGPVAPQSDRFDEDRAGLDHLSFSVGSRAELDEVRGLLEREGIRHGGIKELAALGIAVLEFRDPDNIQLEITSPLG